MHDCGWEEIRSFNSPGEFQRFLVWVDAQVQSGECEELFIRDDSVKNTDSRLFRCISTGDTWRLTFPDPGYFSGSWLPESGIGNGVGPIR